MPFPKKTSIQLALMSLALGGCAHHAAPAQTPPSPGAQPSQSVFLAHPLPAPVPGSSHQLELAQTLVGLITHGHFRAAAVYRGPSGLVEVIAKPTVPVPNLPGARTGNVAWMTANGKVLLPGLALGMNGINYTAQALQVHHLITPALRPSVLYRDASNPHDADSFLVGTRGPKIVAIIDPNCIFCHKFYEKAMPWVKRGQLRIRFVVAGFLKPSSVPKAETLLSAPSPAQALAHNEAHFQVRREEGGLTADRHPDPQILRAVRENTRLLTESGETATPTLIYAKKGHFAVYHGLPPHTDAFLRSLSQ